MEVDAARIMCHTTPMSTHGKRVRIAALLAPDLAREVDAHREELQRRAPASIEVSRSAALCDLVRRAVEAARDPRRRD